MANDSIVDIRNGALQLSNFEDSGFVTPAEVDTRVNEAVSAYYDLVLGSRETYFQSTAAFTLAGGLTGNTFALPTDLYKVQALDKDPGTTNVTTVPTLPSFRERHSTGRRCYSWVPGALTIYPPNSSAGNYLLYYTPYPPVMADKTVITTTYTPDTSIARTIPGADGVDASGAQANWFFGSAPFTAVPSPAALFIQNAANAGNNGMHTILSVPDSRDARTSKTGITTEMFADGVTAQLVGGPFDSVSYAGNNTWVFNDADFTGQPIGATITISGSASSDGTYNVVSVIDSHTILTDGAAHFETFGPGVTVSYQPVGTIYRLPNTMQSGSLWLKLFVAVGIAEKAEMPAAMELQARLDAQTKRIQDALRWKQDEPRQAPLVRRRGWNGYRGGGWGNC